MKEIMLELVKAGADVFRINFSHADYELVKRNVDIIREINQEYGYNISILGDLQGEIKSRSSKRRLIP